AAAATSRDRPVNGSSTARLAHSVRATATTQKIMPLQIAMQPNAANTAMLRPFGGITAGGRSAQQRPASIGIAAGRATRGRSYTTDNDGLLVLPAILRADAIGLGGYHLAGTPRISLPRNRLAAGCVFQRTVFGLQRIALFTLAQTGTHRAADEAAIQRGYNIVGNSATGRCRRAGKSAQQAAAGICARACAAGSQQNG